MAACLMLFIFHPHRNVYVVVVPLRRTRGVVRHPKSPDEMDLEEVSHSAPNYYVTQLKRLFSSLKIYVYIFPAETVLI